MEWRKFDALAPPEEGRPYLVWCVAPQWDSAWWDRASFRGGRWKEFGSPSFSTHDRVRYYATVSQPNDSA